MLDLKSLAVVNRSIEAGKFEATSALISNETMVASTNNTTRNDASVPRNGSRDTLRKEEEQELLMEMPDDQPLPASLPPPYEQYDPENPPKNFAGPYDIGINLEYRPLMRYRNGCQYQGQMNKETGRREGLGTLTRADGSYYYGMWVGGKRHGRGREVTVNGLVFEGEYKDDFKNGEGEESHQCGYSYKGQFQAGKKHGQGQQVYPSGDTYVGRFETGVQSGEGTITFAEGGFYSGEWKSGKYNGYGTKQYKYGQKHTGQWLNDKRHGEGLQIKKDGTSSAGVWANDKRVKWTGEQSNKS